MRLALAAAVLFVTCIPAYAEEQTANTTESSIKEHFKDFAAAWAKHDARAVAAFYTEKAEIVTESGVTFSGRDGIEQALSEAFDNSLKDSTLTITVQKIRLIKPDVALIDSEVQIKPGDGDPNTVHMLSLLVNHDGKWVTETSRAIAYK